jgi:broad specificity phosphatase PhoE
MTRVFYVRHGHPAPAVSQEEPDPSLSPLGLRQARGAADWLKRSVAERPRVLSSSARRALQTATLIGERLDVEVVTDPELAEIGGAGDADPETRAARHPNGETLGHALDRFTSVLSRAVEAHPGDDLVLVSHKAFVVMGLLHLCEHDWDPMTIAERPHCAVIELDIDQASSTSLGRVCLQESTAAEARDHI